MSLFKTVNPKLALGTGIVVFFIGVVLAWGKVYSRASLFYIAGGFAVIVWAVAMKKRKSLAKQ